MLTGELAVSSPPLVVSAQVGQAMVPVVVIVPPVIGLVVAMLLTEPEPVPTVMVEPLMRTCRAELVVQRSPLLGLVGAVPGVRFKPAPAVVDAAVVSLPVPVIAGYVAVPLIAGLISVIVLADKLAGRVVEIDGTPVPDVTSTPPLAVESPATAVPLEEYQAIWFAVPEVTVPDPPLPPPQAAPESTVAPLELNCTQWPDVKLPLLVWMRLPVP